MNMRSWPPSAMSTVEPKSASSIAQINSMREREREGGAFWYLLISSTHWGVLRQVQKTTERFFFVASNQLGKQCLSHKQRIP